MHISFIVAIADNGVIGHEGELPWRLRGDMKRFRELTMGKPVIMGRKTWESLPKRPLDGRPNLIVTRQKGYEAPGAEVFHSVRAALARARLLCRNLSVDEVMILGGAQIYAALLDEADRMYITEVHAAPDGDAFFPAFNDEVWKEVSREPRKARDGDTADYSFVLLERAVASED